MKVQIVTTITTLIDVGSFEAEHALSIDAEDAEGFPMSAIYAAVEGACKSALAAVQSDADERGVR